jgi:hypothetical protein
VLGVHGRSMMSRGEVYLNFRGGEVTSTYPYPVTNRRQVSRTTMPAKARTRTNAMRAVATSRNVASLPIVRRARQKAPGTRRLGLLREANSARLLGVAEAVLAAGCGCAVNIKRRDQHTSPSRGRVAGTAVCSQYGTRPEYGTRGVSHPRNGRAPAGAPPTSRPPLAVREDGGVVWSSDGAPFAHPVSCLL